MPSLTERERDRFRFLRQVYDLSDGHTLKILDMWTVGQSFGMDRDTIESVQRYLHDEGLTKYVTLGGGISITHNGVKEIEESQRNPKKPTEHFSPTSFIIVGQMTNSVIQQSSPEAVQAVNRQNDEYQVVHELLEELKQFIQSSSLSEERRDDAYTDISTIDVQARAKNPKFSIVTESIKSLRSVLEETAGNVTAAAIIDRIGTLLSG